MRGVVAGVQLLVAERGRGHVEGQLGGNPTGRYRPASGTRRITWRDMIRMNDQVPVPAGTIVGLAATPLPRPAEIIEKLGPWRRAPQLVRTGSYGKRARPSGIGPHRAGHRGPSSRPPPSLPGTVSLPPASDRRHVREVSLCYWPRVLRHVGTAAGTSQVYARYTPGTRPGQEISRAAARTRSPSARHAVASPAATQGPQRAESPGRLPHRGPQDATPASQVRPGR